MKSYHVDYFDVDAEEEGPVTALQDYEGDQFKYAKNFTSDSTVKPSHEEEVTHTLHRNSVHAPSIVNHPQKRQSLKSDNPE